MEIFHRRGAEGAEYVNGNVLCVLMKAKIGLTLVTALSVAIAMLVLPLLHTPPSLKQLPPTQDLLLNLADMPVGWESTGAITESVVLSFNNNLDGALVSFRAIQQSPERGKFVGAQQFIYRYGNVKEATYSYSKMGPAFSFSVPIGWIYKSSLANQSSFACQDVYPQETCYWAGRYNEYVVLFEVPLSDKISLHEIEIMVRKIDAKMQLELGLQSAK